jgi:hypothetical protein
MIPRQKHILFKGSMDVQVMDDRTTLFLTQDEGVTRGRVGDTDISDEDAATVFNEGMDLLPCDGGTVHVDAGYYEITDSLVVDRPVHLEGMGCGNTTNRKNMTMLVATPELDGPVVHVTGTASEGGFMHGTRIVDMGIVGAKESGQGTDCLRFATDDAEVELGKMFAERLLVDSATRHGVALDDGLLHVIVRDVWSGHHGESAFAIEGGERYWLTNCYGYDSEIGIDIGPAATNVMLTQPFCRRHRSSGIRLQGRQIQVLGGSCINNENAGVEVGGAEHVLITDGHQFDNTEQGIHVTGDAEHVKLLGNAVGNLPGTDSEMTVVDGVTAIAEDGVRDVFHRAQSKGADYLRDLVVGGGVDKSQKVGIKIDEGAIGTIVSDTLFANTTEDDVVDKGTRTVQEGLGRNRGDPRRAGAWHGHGREGIRVCDVEGERFFTYVDGAWRPLGA